MLRGLAALGVAFVLNACDSFSDCSNQLNQKFLPSDTTISIGQQFTAQVLVTSCGGREILNASPTWHSQDPSVASVDSIGGRVTGRATGQTSITATGAFYTLTGSIHVTVR